MLEMRRCDNDGINLTGLDESLPIAEKLEWLEFLQRSKVGITHRGKLAALNSLIEQIIGVILADIAHANDSKPNFVHQLTSTQEDNSLEAHPWDRELSSECSLDDSPE
jgi:hypothetical protein